MDKYSINFPKEVTDKNIMRLTNQIWKLIPMYESKENWEKQLDTVIVEIAGLGEIFYERPQFLQVLSKLEGIKVLKPIEFFIYRKTIFEVINLLQEIKKNG